MKFIKIIILCSVFMQIGISQNSEFKTRVSLFNFAFDYTKYSNFRDPHRSISIIPIMIEKENFEAGLYLTPFIKENYNAFGNYEYDKLFNSYLINARLRYTRPLNEKINMFTDFAYCDGNAYNWKNIYISWIEFGVYRRLNYSTKIFAGYKYTLKTNENINMDGFFLNFVFGYSFLKRK